MLGKPNLHTVATLTEMLANMWAYSPATGREYTDMFHNKMKKCEILIDFQQLTIIPAAYTYTESLLFTFNFAEIMLTFF